MNGAMPADFLCQRRQSARDKHRQQRQAEQTNKSTMPRTSNQYQLTAPS